MFKDRALILGLAVAALGVALSLALYALAATFLTVRQEVKLAGLDVYPRSIIFADIGDSEALSARDYFSDRSFGDWEDDVSYMSTDPSVVSVNARGIATAQAAGAADIVASRGDFSVDIPVIVYGEIRMPPPVDPDMIGIVPAIDPQTPVVLNRLMVELRPGYGLTDAQTLAAAIGGDVVFSFRTFPGHIIEFDPSTRELDAALQAMETEPTVEAAYPDTIIEFSDTDTFDNNSPGSPESLPYERAGFQRAWELMETIDKIDLAPVNIVVIDTGFQNPAALFDPDWKSVIESEFPKISITPDAEGQIGRLLDRDGGNIVVTYQTEEQTDDAFVAAHGTAVASVIAAANNLENNSNSKSPLSGVVASVPNLHWNLHMFSVGNAAGSGWVEKHLTSSLQNIASLENVGQMGPGIDVVNMSISKFDNPESELMDRWRDIAEGMPDVTFVAAAGNCERDASIWVPANWSSSMSNAITVGGTNYTHADRWRTGEAGEEDDIFCDASFYHGSAFGPSIRDTGVAAPAQGVLAVELVSIDGDGYGPTRGTSIATPMVTGTVALLRAISPDHSPEKIRKILRDSAETVEICTSNYPKDSCLDGDKEPWKFLRADRAVDMLLTELVDAEIDPPHGTITVASVPASGNVTVEATVRNTGKKKWTFYVEASVGSASPPDYIELESFQLTLSPDESRTVSWEIPVAGYNRWVGPIFVKRDDINDPKMDRELSNDRVLATELIDITVPAAPPTPRPTRPALPTNPFAATPTATPIAPTATPIAPAAPPTATRTALPTALPAATPTALPTATPQPPSGRIAFVSDRDGNSEIYTMNADGSDVTRLTDNDVDDTEPSWSPDGQRIAFTSDRDGNSEIYTMNADGSGVTRLTDGNRDGEPEYVVYSSSDGSVGRYTRPADDVPSWSPSWSPDGQRIAFISSRGRIHTMNADGSGVTDIGSSGNSPSWSPDGQRIAFEASNKIYVANADGSGDAILVHSDEISGSPSWSPGPVIAFDYIVGFSEVEYGNWWHQGRLERERSRGREIYVMSPGQYSNTQRLTDSHYDTWSPSWSPDGRHIVFIRSDRSIYTMNADGSGVTSIGSGTSPSWGPAP